MATPFFSIEVSGSAQDVEDTTEVNIYKVYHSFMQLYPAYSVRKIEDELSWREVKKLMEISNKEIATNIHIARISSMMEKYLGATFETIEDKHTNLRNTLKGLGWL